MCVVSRFRKPPEGEGNGEKEEVARVVRAELAEIGKDEGRGWEAANCLDLPSNGRNEGT